MDFATEPAASSPLDLTAPPFHMPARERQTKSVEVVGEQAANGQPKPNRDSNAKMGRKAAGAIQEVPNTTPAVTGQGDGGEQKLSNKELKLKQKAEKQAKRAAQKAPPQAQGPRGAESARHPHQAPEGRRRSSDTGKALSGQGGKTTDIESHHKRTASVLGKIPALRAPTVNTVQNKDLDIEKKPVQDKKVAMFSHLYSKDRRATVAGAGREIHPAVLTLGIQLRDFVICGGNARCIATLLAFKKVIQSYTTPPSVALPRHLTTHLSHQISYLSSSRPLSTSQGNSIRWLKKLVVELDPKISDPDARDFLCKSIDQFIREKITLADEVIASEASQKIEKGDVVLVYAKSSIVEKSLLTAHRDGKEFSVVVVDARPLFEGKNLAQSLVNAGLQVRYCLLTGLGSLSRKVTKCFLGASAMMANGRLYSRAGTALVAMMAKDSGGMVQGFGGAGNVPVIVLCESVKFSSRVVLDSIVNNEIGEADALVEHEDDGIITSIPSRLEITPSGGKKAKLGKAETEGEEDSTKKKTMPLEGWSEQPNLQLLNLMYDVTPAEYLDMVITELGSIPPTAVSAVSGVWGGEA